MPYEMNDKQFESVLALDGPNRYAHFISKVCDWEELWGLRNIEGFVSMADNDGNQCLPFWPHPKYAEASATENWNDCRPEKIELSEFLEKWLPGMHTDNIKAAVFPTLESQGVLIDPLEHKEHLEAECKQYE